MTLLVISPDYASHLLPLATLATAWRDAGEDVVVATGPATQGIVDAFGFRRVELQLGRGSNAGVLRTEEQQDDEARSLRGFFDATRRGMIATLEYQARERLTDLMWQPVDRARRTLGVVDQVQPSAILVDHLAYSARLGLETAGIRYGDVVLGHPTALPVGGEVYGCPPAWPRAFSVAADEIARLDALCREVARGFTAQWNAAATEIDPAARALDDAFAAHGDTVLYNYPELLAAGDGRELPPRRFLGSTLREEPVDPEIEEWIARDEPFVYVSFGSFLSVRSDVLAQVARAVQRLGLRAAIATGSSDPADLGAIPDGWLVRGFLPQVRLLRAATVAVTHGGNNSVTEATALGVPLLVLPFSTDQFAGAAAIERTGLGRAADPNAATPAELADALAELADPALPARATLRAEAARQAAHPGPSVAYAALSSAASPSSTN